MVMQQTALYPGYFMCLHEMSGTCTANACVTDHEIGSPASDFTRKAGFFGGELKTKCLEPEQLFQRRVFGNAYMHVHKNYTHRNERDGGNP